MREVRRSFALPPLRLAHASDVSSVPGLATRQASRSITFAWLSLFGVLLSLASNARSQVEWLRRDILANPANTSDYDVTYDLRRMQYVFFGGSGVNNRDTWIFDGSRWRMQQRAVAPPARAGHKLVYGITRNHAVLFGGRDWSLFDDTWIWDGDLWTRVVTVTKPPARADHALAFDEARGRHVLFGGRDAQQSFADTWTFDGSQWQHHITVGGPPARTHASMSYDPRRGRVLLFGGSDGNGYLGDAWEWDGGRWTRIVTSSGPEPRRSAGMAYDRFREVQVLHGGVDASGLLNDTWEFDGLAWKQRFSSAKPPAAWKPILSYDLASQRMTHLGQDWMWSYGSKRPAHARPFGTSCGRTHAKPFTTCHRLPWLGRRLEVDTDNVGSNALTLLALGFSRSRFGAAVLPLLLDSEHMPGCALLVSIEAVESKRSLGGKTRWTFDLPDLLSFAGNEIHAQAFVFDPLANARGIAASNGLTLGLGAL